MARAAIVAVDRELASLASSLDMLGLATSLTAGDLEAFHVRAAEVRERLGITAVLRDTEGRQIVNPRLPWGSPLPQGNLPLPAEEAWRGARALVSDLFIGAAAQEPIFAVQVQVPRREQGAPPYLLSASLPVTRIRQVLVDLALPEGWTLAVVDGSGTILARNTRHEAYVGRPATQDLRENTRGIEGTWRGTTVDGEAVLAAYARSRLSDWRAAVGVPEHVLTLPLRRSLMLLAALGGALALLSGVLALVFGRRIAGPLGVLAAQAAAIGRGEPVPPRRTRIREATRASEALAQASALLVKREAELRSLNAALEERVAQRTRNLEEANARLVAEAAERARAEAQLRQAQKMEAVGRLTGGVAHDFNNLLTVVIGNIAMALRRLEEDRPARAEAALRGAAEGARRAAELTARLLAFSRQQPLAPKPVDANTLVAGMSDLLRRTLGADIQVETVLAGGLWRAHADPNQLEAAILNMAVNARDAMPDGGRLTIETANAHLDEAYAATQPDLRPGQYVMVSVSDTGMGMAPEIAARAFEPFFTTKPVGQGTGLGLSQVYGFARQSGGHVAIYSEPDEGTTVRIYLPRLPRHLAAEGEAPAAAAPAACAAPRRGQGETILVVEDEALVRDFAVATLEEAGYRVLAAADGPTALELLARTPDLALLFTDVVLAGPMNGQAVAQAAAANRPGLPVLFTTGYTRNAIIHHGRLDEGIELLAKPYGAAELEAKVRRILDGPGGGRAEDGLARA